VQGISWEGRNRELPQDDARWTCQRRACNVAVG